METHRQPYRQESFGDGPAALTVPSNLLAGAMLGSLMGGVAMVVAQSATTGMMVTGASVLGVLGLIHGLGVARRSPSIAKRSDVTRH